MRHIRALIEEAKFAFRHSELNIMPRWLGHHGFRISLTTMIAMVAFAGIKTFFDLPIVVERGGNMLILTVMYWTGIAQFEHAKRLCEKCATSMPLDDPSIRAKRRRPQLATAHLVSDNVRRFLLVMVLAAGLLYLAKRSGLINDFVHVTLLMAPMMWLFWSQNLHAKLQPWCPRCRGGGGAGDWATAPTPIPAISR